MKTKIITKIIPNFIRQKLFPTSQTKIPKAKMEYEKTEFREELRKYLGHMETKSLNQDYQMVMKYLYTQDKIDTTKREEEKTPEKEVLDKLDKEREQINSNFFNDFSLKILENTKNQNLINLACKSYVGDTDIPHDPERSFLILRLAKLKSENESQLKETQFFLDYFRKNSAKSESEMKEATENIFNDTSNIKAKYVTSRDLFKIVTYNYMDAGNQDMTKDEKDFIYTKLYHNFEQASNEGIYEAFYFLGVMNLNGLYTKVNYKKAFYLFSIAASYSHSLAYYELYRMLKEDKVKIYKENENNLKIQAMFDYLKTAAEEGYVEAMHELGNQYLIGEITKRNRLKALAWHRQACRNGFILSYEPCGDLLYSGGDGIIPNKALSLVMYYCAYTKGLNDLKDKILNIREELNKEGEPIPEMILI